MFSASSTSRGHPHCEVSREVYATLPPEANPAFPGECALLERCLYGLRDAPQRFELKVGEILKELGFTQGVFSPCLFFNPKTQLAVFVHGDDFVVKGGRGAVRQCAKELNDHLIVKVRATLGPLEGDDKAVTILNRIVSWVDGTSTTKEAIEIEAESGIPCAGQVGPQIRHKRGCATYELSHSLWHAKLETNRAIPQAHATCGTAP